MSARIVITKPGYDAKGNPDPRNVNFDSDLESLKYYKLLNPLQDIVEIFGDSTSGWVEETTSHNLGYVPFFVAYVGSFNIDPYQMVPVFIADGSQSVYASVWADTTQIHFRALINTPTTTFITFYFKVFRNSLGL